MTISTQQSQITLAGTGAATTFDFNFVGDSVSDIIVSYINASGIVTPLASSQYSIALNAPAVNQLWGVGGTITYPLTGSPIAIGTSLLVQRVLPLTQQVSIQNQGNFYAQVTEQALDVIEMQLQQVSARGGAYRGVWATGIVYNFGDIVQDGINGNFTNNIYVCAIANTSGVWNTDLAKGDWVLVISVSSLQPPGSFLPLTGGTISGNLNVLGTTTTANINASSDNSGGTIAIDVTNTASAANTYAVFQAATGTANSTVTLGLNDNAGSPVAYLGLGSAISVLDVPPINASGNITASANSVGNSVQIISKNTAIGANTIGQLVAQTGTTNSYATFTVNDNNGSPTASIIIGSAVPSFTLPQANNLLGSTLQSWTSETSSRALSTTYTNSTGRPIQIMVNCTPGSGTGSYSLTLTVGGVTAAFENQYLYAGGTGALLTAYAIVPPGVTYEATTTGSGASLNAWSELR